MTVYSTQSSGRDARHALATPTFYRLKDGHHSSTREHRTLDIKSSLFCLPPPSPTPCSILIWAARTALPRREALRQR